MVLQELFIIVTILLIIDLILLGVGSYAAYQHLMPLIIRKLLEKNVSEHTDEEYGDRVLKVLKQVAKDYPESKRFMLILKAILITKKKE